jgi:bifunctional DNA-binding transcriptional regulator/antitoxin component of YhaV-PrlF toxin-antitoxin module
VTHIEIEVSLRQKNQLTLPEPIAARLGAHPGDRLLLEMLDDAPGQVQVRLLRRSYAGALKGVYGTADEAAAFIRDERAAWDE